MLRCQTTPKLSPRHLQVTALCWCTPKLPRPKWAHSGFPHPGPAAPGLCTRGRSGGQARAEPTPPLLTPSCSPFPQFSPNTDTVSEPEGPFPNGLASEPTADTTIEVAQLGDRPGPRTDQQGRETVEKERRGTFAAFLSFPQGSVQKVTKCLHLVSHTTHGQETLSLALTCF